MKQRLIWIDNLKAYGIILVIIGHSVVLPSTYGYSEIVMKLVYSFHMPLFFFISGYLFHNRKNIFLKKWKTLILPYYAFQLISVVVINAFYYLTSGQLERNPLSTLLSFFYLNGSVGWNSPLWFLVVLAIIDVLFYSFNLLGRYARTQILIVFFTCIIGWLLSEKGIRYPFGLHIVFSCFIFYYIGNLTKKHNLINLVSENYIVNLVVIITSGAFLFSSTIWFNETIYTSLYDNYLGTNYIMFILTALSGIFFSFLLFQKLNKNTIFTIFGEKSILLLGTQYFFLLGFDTISRMIGIYSSDLSYLVIKVVLILMLYKVILSLWTKIENS